VIRLLAVVAILLGASAPATNPRPAEPVPPAESGGGSLPAGAQRLVPNFRDAVYGDFRLVGNGVLRCPKPGEDTGGGHSAEDCHAATHSTGPDTFLDDRGHNNGYRMYLADEDSDPATFDSSSARLTIPAGATVRYAQLNWGGHTGKFVGFSGVNCARPVLFEGQPPPAPAAPTPAEQRVRLAVAGGGPVPVGHTDG